MKILVPVKRVLDYNLKPRIKADGSGIDIEGSKMSMNPFDEIALEEAVKLKEAKQATEVIALTIGSAKAEEVLRTALAMGADMAYMGTRFIASQEAKASQAYKDSLVSSQASDIIYSNLFCNNIYK